MNNAAFAARLAAVGTEIEAELDALIGFAPRDGERARPQRLIEAMRYAILGGGKRLRPFLVVETARAFGAGGDGPRRVGAAFQIADDLLDAEGDAATLGKRVGKDAGRNKATFVAALGLEGARAARRAGRRGDRRGRRDGAGRGGGDATRSRPLRRDAKELRRAYCSGGA